MTDKPARIELARRQSLPRAGKGEGERWADTTR